MDVDAARDDDLAAGVLPLLPGFLGSIGAATVAPFWASLYHYAWFISFGLSFGIYWLLMRGGK